MDSGGTESHDSHEDGRGRSTGGRRAVGLAVVLVAAFATVLVGPVASTVFDVGLSSWTVEWLSAVRFDGVFLGGILAVAVVDLRRLLAAP